MQGARPGPTVDASCLRGMVGDGKGWVQELAVVSPGEGGICPRGPGAAARNRSWAQDG
jgi:hypothetical protein